jgi:RimJ/RimL family protein N-acetyltransferase
MEALAEGLSGDRFPSNILHETKLLRSPGRTPAIYFRAYHVIELISPFPTDFLADAWKWLQESPEHNFDDYGPRTLAEFEEEMAQRLERGERTWAVQDSGQLCGMIGYLPMTPRWGCFHGICFARRVCGTSTTRLAVARVIHELSGSGVEKISASYFATNLRVRRFLEDLGAVDEGYLSKQTLRDGKPIDMRLVAIFKD